MEKIELLYTQERQLEELEEAIAYRFKNKLLLIEALTHRSFTHEHPFLELENNQRLEFLGDAVLGLSIAHAAYEVEPLLPEGKMTRLRAAVVCEESLADIAIRIELADYLQLGNGEIVDGGREKSSILADAMEAVFAAIYLDSGLKEAKACILRLMQAHLFLALNGKLTNDYKSSLLEYAQSQANQPQVLFSFIEKTGPAHKQAYVAEVRMGEFVANGQGSTKKQAEQEAAKRLLNML